MYHDYHDENSCNHSHHRHGGHAPRGLDAVFAGFGARGFRGPFAPGARGFGGFGGSGGGRARRGDVRAGVLRLLAEQPMHGYQVIQELSARSGGAWNPSAGSVYPTLQMLEDEGLVTSTESSGKRVYELTEAGRKTVADAAGKNAPWDEAASTDAGGGLREQMPRVGAAVWQIGMTGDPDKIARAADILSDARKKLFAILAED
jgi:DNA-binding PadR family transcriptional regulator